MAEIRKFDPDAGDGLQKLVRDALGENIRPIEPGQRQPSTSTDAKPAEPDLLTTLDVNLDFLSYGDPTP